MYNVFMHFLNQIEFTVTTIYYFVEPIKYLFIKIIKNSIEC